MRHRQRSLSGHPPADRKGSRRSSALRRRRTLPAGCYRDHSHDRRPNLDEHCLLPKGAGITGIAWIDIDAKYRTLVPRAGLPDHQVEASLAVIHDFRGVTNVSALTDLLNPPDGWSRRRRV